MAHGFRGDPERVGPPPPRRRGPRHGRVRGPGGAGAAPVNPPCRPRGRVGRVGSPARGRRAIGRSRGSGRPINPGQAFAGLPSPGRRSGRPRGRPGPSRGLDLRQQVQRQAGWGLAQGRGPLEVARRRLGLPPRQCGLGGGRSRASKSSGRGQGAIGPAIASSIRPESKAGRAARPRIPGVGAGRGACRRAITVLASSARPSSQSPRSGCGPGPGGPRLGPGHVQGLG